MSITTAVATASRFSLRSIFYGWRMVAAGVAMQIVVSGLMMQSFGAYVAVLQSDLGWSRAALAGAFSLIHLVGGLSAPLQGWFIDRYGPRAMMRVGITFFGLGMMALSQVDSVPTYYAAFVLIALGFRLSSFFPLSVAFVNWFRRKRARALSTLELGFAIGGLVVPLVAAALETFGWRTTAFGSGIILIAAGLPISQVMRTRPEDYGEVVDGDRGAQPEAEPDTDTAAPEPSFTARQALRTPAFWLISLGHGSSLLVVGAVNVHLISHLRDDLGYSVGSAALVVTLLTSLQVVGILVAGALGDRVEKRLLSAACMLMHMVGMLMVTFAVSLPMVVGFALLHGVAWGLRGALMQAMRADYFGRASFGVILGLSATVVMWFQITGPLLAGFMADQTGDYRAGFTLMALLAGAGTLFFMAAKRPVQTSV